MWIDHRHSTAHKDKTVREIGDIDESLSLVYHYGPYGFNHYYTHRWYQPGGFAACSCPLHADVGQSSWGQEPLGQWKMGKTSGKTHQKAIDFWEVWRDKCGHPCFFLKETERCRNLLVFVNVLIYKWSGFEEKSFEQNAHECEFTGG